MATKFNATLVSIACLSLLGLLMGGCAFGLQPRTSYEANSQVLILGPVVVFQNSAGPLSYHSPTGKDVRVTAAPRVKGKACQQGLQLPFLWKEGLGVSLSSGWGHGAYAEALAQARAGLPEGAVLYDVRVDINHFSVLSVYRRQCLRLDAGVAVPMTTAEVPTGPLAPARPAGSEASPPVINEGEPLSNGQSTKPVEEVVPGTKSPSVDGAKAP